MIRFLRPYKKVLAFVISGSLLFYAVSGINSLLNYALYPVLSRILPVSDYGEAQFLLSAFNQLSVGFIVLNILAIILAALLKDRKTQDRSIASLNVVAGVIAVAIACAGVIVLSTLSNTLGLESNVAILLLGASLLLNVPFTIFVGQLQGNGKFIASAIVSFVATFAKFGFSILFALLGFSVAGVIGGVVLGMLIAVILCLLYLKGVHYSSYKKPLLHHLQTISFIKTQAIVGFCSIGIITVLSAMDSIASRVLLDSVDAGLYSTVATISKIILAATAPILWLALPQAVGNNFASVWKYIGLTAAIGGICVLAFSINPSVLIQYALSVDSLQYALLVPMASISMAIYAIGLLSTAVLLCSKRHASLLRIYGALILTSVILAVYSAGLPAITMQEVIIGQIILGLVITVPGLVALSSAKKQTL